MGGPLKVHHLRPAAGAHTKKTRVGRGNASKGKTAGRGTKGSKARSRIPATFEGGQMPIHMRLPKLKGFNNSFRTEYQVVNVAALAELFPRGGPGELGSVKLDVTANAFSGTARDKIEAAGGTVTQL